MNKKVITEPKDHITIYYKRANLTSFYRLKSHFVVYVNHFVVCVNHSKTR